MDTPWFAKRPVSDVRPGDHGWLAYTGAEERDRVIGTFVREGLRHNEKVVYVSDAPADRLPGLDRPLDGHRIDIGAYTRIGQLRVISRADACLDRRGAFEPAMLADTLGRELGGAFAEGFRAVRLTTDHSWALSGPGRAGLAEMLGCEHRVGDTVAPSTMAMAICQVDRRACTGPELLALRDTHEVLIEVDPEFDDGVLRIVRTFEPHGLRLEGELDGSRHAVLADRLAAVDAAGRRVHLDVARLRFIDLGGLHLLARHALALPADESLVLDHLAPDVENVIEMVGWRRLPGLARGADAAGGMEDLGR